MSSPSPIGGLDSSPGPADSLDDDFPAKSSRFSLGRPTTLDKIKNFHIVLQVSSVVASSVLNENVRVPWRRMPRHRFSVVAVVLNVLCLPLT